MEELTLNIISDSLGNTAEHVAKAALAQFELDDYDIHKYSFITDEALLYKVLETISKTKNPIILYTVVNTELSALIKKIASENNIPCIDLLGSILQSISGLIGREPFQEPGMLRKLNNYYFKRVEAIEFAVRYDDGKDPRGLLKADVVIIGISRTSKTPLSMYLANKNYKVANVPLVPESKPPEELFKISPLRIIGLTNSPEKLNEIRQTRLQALGLPNGSSYADMNRILEEIDYAETIMRKIGCPIIDVSHKAIEETAELVIKYLKNNGININYD